MIGILLVTHGTLAEGFKDAAQLIVGEQDNFSTIGLFSEDSVDDLPERIEEAVNNFEDIDGILILADLFGASPFNASARFINTYKAMPANVIAGINLGMLLEVLMQREFMTVSELSDLAMQSGQKGMVSFDQILGEN